MSADGQPENDAFDNDLTPLSPMPEGTHCPLYGSAWNDPASLPGAVLRLLKAGATPEEMRIIPHVGHVTQPEIVARPVNTDVWIHTLEERYHALYINIRPQNRLHWLYPLFRQRPKDKAIPGGAVPEPEAQRRESGGDAELLEAAEQTAETLWNDWFMPHLEPREEEQACFEIHGWLMERSPEWAGRLGFVPVAKGWVQTGYTTPVQWLARLWRALFPQLTFMPPKEPALPTRLRLIGNALFEEQNPNRTAQQNKEPHPQSPRDDAALLAEKFFTLVFLHLAEIDMLEGVAYPMDWTPDPFGNPYIYGKTENPIRVPFDPEDAAGVLHWCMQSRTAGSAWIDTIFPQNGLIGGMGLDDVLLRLMQDWQDDDFLGMTSEDWRLFAEPEARGILWTLLLKRREMTDWGALFDRAARLLVSEEVGIHLQAYQGVESRMGTPLAQMGLTLMLEGEALLRSPEVIVYLPHDRLQEPDGENAQKRLEVLGRLFLPAHVPLRCRWAVDAAVLDETAWLEDGNAPLTREGIPLRSCFPS